VIVSLPASARVALPWKNGGGVTREVCVFPAGAGMDDFLWRISIAEVSQAGPFSVFEGIDRHLSVLSGVLQLQFGDREARLNAGDSLAFAGDTPVTGVPLTPVMDLNVMTRRGRVRAAVRPVEGRCETRAQTAILIDLASLDAICFTDADRDVTASAPSILIEIFQA
jgi:hypothetical protein